MPINPELLIAAPMLQDYLVDKVSGLPLAAGRITLYHDNARSFFKNWYYQTGTPGAYTWVPLDNPLTLSSVGTIQDPQGNDVIPFYYPYSEDDENVADPYYITVYSQDMNGDYTILQFTRENFPFNPSHSNPTAENPVWRNYIINNIYWRNVGTQNLTNVTEMVIAPSQHEGYTNGDIRFIKNVAGATDSLSFPPMTEELPTSQSPNGAITPEVMLAFTCTALQAGETTKCIQYPISLHVDTLNSVQGTILFYGENVAGNPNNYVDLYFYQYLGSGALIQPDPILIQRVVLNNDFQVFEIPFTTPSTDGLTLGNGGDDALFLRVQYPLSLTFNINHTKPQIYFSVDVPSNDFDTYDQVESIINSPRTGDVKVTLSGSTFAATIPFLGYVPMNDGTIGNSSSNATCRKNADTWPLYKMIWESFQYAAVTTSNALAPLFDSTGMPVAYGATAIADFNANKAISLTKQLGRTLLGTIPPAEAPTNIVQETITASNDGGGNLVITVAANTYLYKGMPIVFTNTGGALPGNLTNAVFFISDVVTPTTQFYVSTTYANALAGTYVAFSSAGTGTNKVNYSILGGQTGEYAHTQLVAELAAHFHTTFPNFGTTNASAGGGVNAATAAPGANTGTTGSSKPFNVMQPSTYLNMYMKL